MMLKITLVLAAVVLPFSISAAAQPKKAAPPPSPSIVIRPISQADAVKGSPAYAEVLLRKTELASDLESLLVEYTEDYPKVKEARYESEVLQKELDRMIALPAAETRRLTLALGRLMVRRAEIETVLWGLRQQFSEDYPEVKRTKKKAEIFESAIREIMQGK